MSPRKPASQELTKEMIVKEADEQFKQKGFQHVSMRGIAKQLGCSHGALYYHFKNKAELFNEVVAQYFEQLNQQIDKTVQLETTNETKLLTLFLAFIQFGLDHQSQYEFMFLFKNEEVDALAKPAAFESYEKFAQTVHSIATKNVSISSIYAGFLSLHGFISYYLGRTGSYLEVEEVAQHHAVFVQRAFVKEK